MIPVYSFGYTRVVKYGASYFVGRWNDKDREFQDLGLAICYASYLNGTVLDDETVAGLVKAYELMEINICKN